MARAPGVPVVVTSSQGTNASRLRHNGNNQSDLEAEYAAFEASWAAAYAQVRVRVRVRVIRVRVRGRP